MRLLHHDNTCLQMERLSTIMNASLRRAGSQMGLKTTEDQNRRQQYLGPSWKMFCPIFRVQYFYSIFCDFYIIFLRQQWRSALTYVDIDNTAGLRSLIQSPHLCYKTVLYLFPDQIAAVLLPGEFHLLFPYRYRLSMDGLSNFCWYIHRWTFLKQDKLNK